jgi:hypothetical protein
MWPCAPSGSAGWGVRGLAHCRHTTPGTALGATWRLPSGPDHQVCGQTPARLPAGPQRSPEGAPGPRLASGARRTHARRGGTPNGPGPFRSHERTTPSGKRADPKRNQPVPKVPGNPTWAWQLVRGDRVGGLAVADDGFGDRQAAVETRRCDARQFRLLRRGDAEVPPCLDCYPVATYRQVPSGGSQVVGSWSPLDSLSCASTPTSVRGSLRSL